MVQASKLYELHLYTMGNKLYATEMAKLLDPKGTLFHGRVISKGDEGDPFDGDERVPKSKDLDGVLGMESAVVIIDDSVRVWPHNKHNLIVVERYLELSFHILSFCDEISSKLCLGSLLSLSYPFVVKFAEKLSFSAFAFILFMHLWSNFRKAFVFILFLFEYSCKQTDLY